MTQRIDRRTLLASAGWIGAAGMGAVTAAEDANAGGAVPLAQDYTVVFHNPDRELYVEGCGLAKLPDGALVAVVPVVPRSATGGWQARPSTTHIVRSTDGGESWQPSAQLPFYSAVPWLHQGSLYLFAIKAGTRYRNDDLLLLRSGDGGKTWSDPVTLFEGHFWNCHTGMVRRDNRLYWAFCDIPSRLQHGPPQRRPRVIAGDLSKNPMDPRCWRLSEPASFPEVPAVLQTWNK